MNKWGGLDEQFSPGNYEDDDYSLRIIVTGYKLLLCRDTFIHHFGSASFGKSTDPVEFLKKQQSFQELLKRNFKKFIKKWGFSEKYGTGVGTEVLAYVNRPMTNCNKILVLDCGCGDTVLWLKKFHPEAEICGFAGNENEAKIAGFITDVKVCCEQEDIFSLVAPGFDLIVLGDSLVYSQNPKRFVEKLAQLLNPGGIILLRAHNLMHWSCIKQFSMGFGYNHKQISLGGNLIAGFSKRDMVELFADLPYKGLQILGGVTEEPVDEAFFAEVLKQRFVRTKQEAEASSWLVMVKKGDSDECREHWRQYRLLAELACKFTDGNVNEEGCRLIWERYLSIGAVPAQLSEVLQIEVIEGYVPFVVNLVVYIYPQRKKTAISLLIEAYKLFPTDHHIVYTLAYLLQAQEEYTVALQVLLQYKGSDSDILQLRSELQAKEFHKGDGD